MSKKSSESGGYNRETFETDLETLIDRARTAGVDLRGGYDVRRTDDGAVDYTVEISAVTRPPSE